MSEEPIMSSAQGHRIATPLERHIQTAFGALLIGLVAWVGVSVTDSRESIAAMKVKQDQQTKSIEKVEEKLDRYLDNRVTRAEAVSTHSKIDARLDECNERMRAVESKVQEITGRVNNNH